MGRQQGPQLVQRKGSTSWYIQGSLFQERIRQSTGTSSREEAELILTDVIGRVRQRHLRGEEAPVADFNTLAAKHLNESDKASIKEDARHIRDLAPFVGELPMTEIYRGRDEQGEPTPLERFIRERAKQSVSKRTVNYALQVLNIVGNLASKRWRGGRGKPLIPYWTGIPLINDREARTLGLKLKKEPYPLNWEEQDALFSELPPLNRDMCLFKVNAGCRENEVCRLRWDWLEKGSQSIWYFEIPGEHVKNRLPRTVILNDVAREVVVRQQGKHPDYVFVYEGNPVKRMNRSAFKKARDRAAKLFPSLKNVGIHSLKHTYGARLRAAGVPEEDRNFLTGHKGKMSMTSYYSAPELQRMLDYSNRVCEHRDNIILLKRKAG